MDPSQSAEGECHYNSEANAVFPSKEYLKRFIDPTADPMKVHSKFLEAWHKFYHKYANSSNSTRALLEFGGGPTVHSLISACEHIETITFADYAESNRNEITMWKENSSGAHNWSSYVKYVVTELEGNTGEGSPENREKQIKEKLKEIIPCNIRAEDFLGSATQFSKFDIIHTNLCLEIACESKEEFNHCIAKLGTLLRPGGYLVILTAKGGAWYTCAGAGSKLFQLKMEEEDIITAVNESGLNLVESYNIEPVKNPLSATKSFQFTIAQKRQ